VLQLGRSLAAEWGCREGKAQIRVNTLSPGYIKTALTAKDMLIPGREEQWSADNMLNRMSYADEYRAPVIFMLSDGSGFMTGADLRVDGGHCAW
jgi:NAD(P)-dependent dehydrogenase (short-subunit alcohol dehydrogenase family)